MNKEAKFQETSELETLISNECKTWACWKDLDEMEQEDVYEGYLKIAKWQFNQLFSETEKCKKSANEMIGRLHEEIGDLRRKISMAQAQLECGPEYKNVQDALSILRSPK